MEVQSEIGGESNMAAIFDRSQRSEALEKKTLPAKFYICPDYFRTEVERLFFEKWMGVGRADQIPNVGDYFLANVGDESVIVARAESGQIKAFFNVCRHRGTRMCEKEKGTFAGRIPCPYHGWTYGLGGNLMGAPHMNDAPNFSLAKYGLHPVGVDTWDGHVFLNFSGTAGSLTEQLGRASDKFRNWKSEDLRLGKRAKYEVKANWKLIVQNYSECLHCPVIHPTLKRLSHYMSGDNEAPALGFMGGSMTLNDGVDSMTVTGKTSRALFRDLDEKQRRHIYYYWIFPNMLLSFHPDYLMTHTLLPKRADLTEVICEFLFHKDEVAKPGFSGEDAFGFWDEVNKEDWHVSELSQLGISSRAYAPGPYSQREGLLYGLDSLLTAHLGMTDTTLKE